MTDRENNLEIVRAACIQANPEIVELMDFRKGGKQYPGLERELRLADVLVAMPNCYFEKSSRVHGGGLLRLLIKDGGFLEWNLRADNLEEQSDERVAFLAGLLR